MANNFYPHRAAEQSVQPTSGIRRVFKQFSTPQQNPISGALSRPAHLRLTQAVRLFFSI